MSESQKTSSKPWLQNVLIIDSWPHCMKGVKEFRAMGIKEGEKGLEM